MEQFHVEIAALATLIPQVHVIMDAAIFALLVLGHITDYAMPVLPIHIS